MRILSCWSKESPNTTKILQNLCLILKCFYSQTTYVTMETLQSYLVTYFSMATVNCARVRRISGIQNVLTSTDVDQQCCRRRPRCARNRKSLRTSVVTRRCVITWRLVSHLVFEPDHFKQVVLSYPFHFPIGQPFPINYKSEIYDFKTFRQNM